MSVALNGVDEALGVTITVWPPLALIPLVEIGDTNASMWYGKGTFWLHTGN